MARALPVGLHHHAEPVPAREGGLAQHRLDHVERERQAVGLFRVDVEPHARGFRQQREAAQARHDDVHHLVALGHLVARRERRELDRNARIVAGLGMVQAPAMAVMARE